MTYWDHGIDDLALDAGLTITTTALIAAALTLVGAAAIVLRRRI